MKKYMGLTVAFISGTVIGGGVVRHIIKKELDKMADDITNPLKDKHLYNELIFNTESDAEEVLDNLSCIISKYGEATVADLCGAIGVIPNFRDYRYGWTDIKNTTIKNSKQGYELCLPKPLRMKDDAAARKARIKRVKES